MELRERVERWVLQLSEQSAADSRATAEAFHKVMTTLSSGAIAVSILFVEKLIPRDRPVICRELLIASWALMVLSLLFILVGFRLTLRDYFRMGRISGGLLADTMFQDEFKVSDVSDAASKFKASPAPDILSWLAVGTLIVGIACMLWFVFVNYA